MLQTRLVRLFPQITEKLAVRVVPVAVAEHTKRLGSLLIFPSLVLQVPGNTSRVLVASSSAAA